uniref:Pseudouridine synthase n=1 Tax=Ananas comosus var. bracteatus TaxID=296719 RepID=A0A6V7PIS9_ANACO|nr:unnamed protein product [Ananas comosus var. bracteatus]
MCSSSALDPDPNPSPRLRSSHAGARLEEAVEVGSGRSRLDAWLASRIRGVSRARIQSSIRSGLVAVNGRTVDKVSHLVKGGDMISCRVSELQPLRAEAEDIPLDIVYEDDHVLVVNKPAHMVVHPAPGNANGTLIDVYHADQFSTEELSLAVPEALVRPGIVHRLDKGTSGLLVVAKDEHSHAHLAEQFKQHTINRVYISLTTGVPNPYSARIEVPIARDPNNRVRMVATSGTNHRHARYAASRYEVIEVLAGGGSALVKWRLETGRTHQDYLVLCYIWLIKIFLHHLHCLPEVDSSTCKVLGSSLLGDEVYGSTKSMALSLLKPRTPSSHHGHLSHMISKLDRPCLHALSLGFEHPHTGEFLRFSCPPPDDFSEVVDQLRGINTSVCDKR